MSSLATFKKTALSFPETSEQPHFEKTSFRIGKKIFATLNEANRQACVKLNEIDQNEFCSVDKNIIRPLSNKWGKQGWTMISLEQIKLDIVKDILFKAYNNVAPAKLSRPFKANENL